MRHVIRFAGFVIIFCILAILLVLADQTIPLFRKPTATPDTGVPTESNVLRVGTDEYRSLIYSLSSTGIIFRQAASGERVPGEPMPLGTATVTSVSQGSASTFAVGLSDGRILPVAISFDAHTRKGVRTITGEATCGEAWKHPDVAPVQQLAYAQTPDGPVLAFPSSTNRLRVVYVKESQNLMGETERSESIHEVEMPAGLCANALALDGRGEHLFVGARDGQIAVYDIRDKDTDPALIIQQRITGKRCAVTVLNFLIGDRTLVAGLASGEVSTWQVLKQNASIHLSPIACFDPHPGPIRAIAASLRNKTFATVDESGLLMVRYGTTGKTHLTLQAPAGSSALAVAPKSDGLLLGDQTGMIHRWILNNPHPEVSWQALFGKVQYEGYDAPAYVWQSTGGTDDFEAKFSLTPLIFGTLKGTLYALMFAIPIALLGALYASQFMHPSLKNIVKPAIEIMAALPSVVLGFIAGLWLAPVLERVVPAVFLFPCVLAVCVLLSLFLWGRTPAVLRRRVRAGSEIFLLIPVVLLAGWISVKLGSAVERGLLGGDFRTWLHTATGLTFDQRNSLVVGFAMGFAVVPIIFTIAEDALANVPHHLRAASLALGASQWQTAIRVVLPTASPGIFSAIMIGFGRAVGETMIVLMATGNTPIMNWSIFNGLRALSANIAVEIPEAPQGGTLYRVLFLAALLLFAMTFVVNTAAEVVRLRLRKRYRVL